MKVFYNNKEIIPKLSSEQTFIGIWFHDDNLTDDKINQMKLYLHQTFYYYRIFDNIEQFNVYMYEKIHVAKIFFIISVSNLPFNEFANLIQRKYSIIEKSYIDTNNIDDLFKEIFIDIKHFSEKTNMKMEINTVSKSIYTSRIDEISTLSNEFISISDRITPIRSLTEESFGFLNFLTMVKILLGISYNKKDIEDMWKECQTRYISNVTKSRIIDNLSKYYKSDQAINYYTKSICFFYFVNQACRTENVRHIYKFRVYINDLDQQLRDLSLEQENNDTKSSITKVYRGKILSASVLQQLIDNEHKLISMNGFLSTTLSVEIADRYSATGENIDDGYVHVQFILKIGSIRQPYAYISSCSAIPDEVEILFSLGTIWCNESIKFKDNLYKIELISYNNLDSRLDILLDNYTKDGCNLSSVGNILREIGNYDEAEWFYNEMLEQPDLSDKTKVYLYYNMGMMRKESGCNSKAIEYFEKAASLLESSITKSNEIKSPREIYTYNTEFILVAAYNNMALIHEMNHDFNQAVQCYKQALDVENGSLLEMGIVNNNLSLLYYRYGHYQEAHNYCAKAVELADETDSCWREFKRNLAYIDNSFCL